MGVIGYNFADFVEGELALISGDVKFCELNFGARIRMVFVTCFQILMAASG